MLVAIRNLGRPGIVSMGIVAVDSALWDLKARILDVALIDLLGSMRPGIPVYGSDANGAYNRKQGLAFASKFAELGVTWFEEPVTSDDLVGLHLIRDRALAGMQIAAGEYGYDLFYCRNMLAAGAVDVLQADASRCGGVSGFLRIASLCEAFALPLSAHCWPTLHLHLCCAARPAIHLEYFHDHVRIERLLFDGIPSPCAGILSPDLSKPGMGIDLKESDAAKFVM